MVSMRPRFGFVLEYVTDVEAAKRWYENVLGLEVQRSHPTYVQFDSFAIASDESPTGERTRELYWLVDDAEAAFKELSQQAEIVLPLKQLPFGKVFAIKDPAGETLLLCEFAQNRPSRPVEPE